MLAESRGCLRVQKSGTTNRDVIMALWRSTGYCTFSPTKVKTKRRKKKGLDKCMLFEQKA